MNRSELPFSVSTWIAFRALRITDSLTHSRTTYVVSCLQGGARLRQASRFDTYVLILFAGGEPHPNHSTIRAPAPTGRVPSNLHACHSPCNVLEVDQRQHQVEYVPLFLLLIFGLSSVVTLAETGRAMIPTGADLPRQDHLLWRSRAMCVCTKDAET